MISPSTPSSEFIGLKPAIGRQLARSQLSWQSFQIDSREADLLRVDQGMSGIRQKGMLYLMRLS